MSQEITAGQRVLVVGSHIPSKGQRGTATKVWLDGGNQYVEVELDSGRTLKKICPWYLKVVEMNSEIRVGDRVIVDGIGHQYKGLKGTVLEVYTSGLTPMARVGLDRGELVPFYTAHLKKLGDQPTSKDMKFRIFGKEHYYAVLNALYAAGYDWTNPCLKGRDSWRDSIMGVVVTNGVIACIATPHVFDDAAHTEIDVRWMCPDRPTTEVMGKRYYVDDLESALATLREVKHESNL